MDRGAWRAAVHGGRKESDTNLATAQHSGHLCNYYSALLPPTDHLVNDPLWAPYLGNWEPTPLTHHQKKERLFS